MIITTCETIPGKDLEPLGLVSGTSIKTPSMVGRQARIDRCSATMAELEEDLTAAAQARKADAVVGVRPVSYASGVLMLVGTAVKFR